MTTAPRPATMGSRDKIEIPFAELNETGTYVFDGRLLRVPEDALGGRSRMVEIVGKEPLTVTKLSENPFIRISVARMAAADLDEEVNF